MPETETALPAPTFLSAKLAAVSAKLTTSPPIRPVPARVTAASTVPSYTLSAAVAVTVMPSGVMSAVALA